MKVGIDIVTEKEGVFDLGYYDFEPIFNFFKGCIEHYEEIVLSYDKTDETLHLEAKCGKKLTITKRA